jgi:hypothetical protein
MRLSRPSILLAASLALFSVTQAAAGQLCKPILSLQDVRISEAREMQRMWTGVLVADASRCSTASGLFDIQFTRLKEVSPDLQFTERFTWVSGQSKLSLDFGGTNGWRIIGSSASRPAHAAISARSKREK